MLFALVSSCADEELIQTSGYRDGEAVTLSFNISVPAETEVAVTRATNENQVDNLTLLVFSDEGDNAKLEQVCTSYDNAGEEFNKGTMSDGADGTHKKFTVTLEASKEEKAIYILANAGSLLFGDASSIAIGNTTLDDLRQIETSITSSSSHFIMSGCKILPIPRADLMTQDFPIYRSHAKVTVDVAESLQEKFTLQGFYLCNAQKDASVVAYPLYDGQLSSTLPDYTDDPVEGEITDLSDFESQNLKTDTQYPAPTQNKVADNRQNTQLFLLVKGVYKEEGQSPVTYYYHADFKTEDGPLDVHPNHHYKVTITDVDRIGYHYSLEGLKGAIAGAENATVDIRDINPDSHHMASDGVTEVGVKNDTLYITGTEEEGPKVKFPVTVYPSIKNDNATITIDIEEEDQSWLALAATTNGFPTEEKDVSINNRPDKYSISTVTLKTKLPNNSGERREARVGISCRGVLTYVTVIQQPPFSADQFGSVSLKVKEYERDPVDWTIESTTTSQAYDYWDFIRSDESSATHVYGISPDAMGGKVRTEGFHAPMSDYQQFVYTFTVPQGDSNSDYEGCTWRIELAPEYEEKLLFWEGPNSDGKGQKLSAFDYRTDQEMKGQTFTFTNDLLALQEGGDITEDAYRYGKKAFRIVVTHKDGTTKETYAYDLYHTGVFNYDDGTSQYRTDDQTYAAGWYYYEVILMGRNYWLDRNLGAKSSAYYSKDTSLGNDDAAGGLYSIADKPTTGEVNIISDDKLEKIAPKGFRVPYMSEFQALTSDSRFRQEFVYATGGGYWDARYETGNPDQGTVYFPKNGMWYGGAAAGTGDTGYYWTQTAALGASGEERGYWLQDMQLSGSNASAGRYRIFREGDQDPTGMSVRCVYNSRVVETLHRYECYVKGYTHVFLYYEDAEGGRTYLNTWPGEMISIYDINALSMYHTFTYESVTDYPELKVVFNLVANNRKVIETYPDDYDTRGGLTLKEEGEQTDKFFHKGGTNWTNTAQ